MPWITAASSLSKVSYKDFTYAAQMAVSKTRREQETKENSVRCRGCHIFKGALTLNGSRERKLAGRFGAANCSRIHPLHSWSNTMCRAGMSGKVAFRFESLSLLLQRCPSKYPNEEGSQRGSGPREMRQRNSTQWQVPERVE